MMMYSKRQIPSQTCSFGTPFGRLAECGVCSIAAYTVETSKSNSNNTFYPNYQTSIPPGPSLGISDQKTNQISNQIGLPQQTHKIHPSINIIIPPSPPPPLHVQQIRQRNIL